MTPDRDAAVQIVAGALLDFAEPGGECDPDTPADVVADYQQDERGPALRRSWPELAVSLDTLAGEWHCARAALEAVPAAETGSGDPDYPDVSGGGVPYPPAVPPEHPIR